MDWSNAMRRASPASSAASFRVNVETRDVLATFENAMRSCAAVSLSHAGLAKTTSLSAMGLSAPGHCIETAARKLVLLQNLVLKASVAKKRSSADGTMLTYLCTT